MANQWEFRRVRQHERSYRDGTRVPHLDMDIYFNAVKVGYVNVHMHKVNVDRGEFDHSVGVTVRLNRKPGASVPAEDRKPRRSRRPGFAWILGILAIAKKTDRSRRS